MSELYDIKREEAVGLAVDFQEKLMPVMLDREGIEKKTVNLSRGLGVLGVPVIATQQYTKGLGETITVVKEAIDDFCYVEKDSFTAICPEVTEKLRASGRKKVILYGIEMHICVMQTAMDLLQQGYDVYLAADCCSSRYPLDRRLGLESMRQAGCRITTSESVLFKLLGRSDAQGFKEISKIIK